LTKQGKADEAKAQYDNAVTAYQKAIEAGDDVAVHLQLALVHDKLGAYTDEIQQLRLLVDPANGAKPDLVKKAQAKLDETLAKVGTVVFKVSPEGATITRDGVQIGDAPMTTPLALVPGAYTFSFAAVGYQPKDVEVKVEAGGEIERSVELAPVPVVVRPVIHDEVETAEAPKQPDRMPLYLGAGATGAFLVAGTAFGIAAISAHKTFVAPKTSPSDRADAQSYGRLRAHLADASFGCMVIAGAFTGYWYWFHIRNATAEAPPERIPPKVDVIPWVQPGGGGFVVTGDL